MIVGRAAGPGKRKRMKKKETTFGIRGERRKAGEYQAVWQVEKQTVCNDATRRHWAHNETKNFKSKSSKPNKRSIDGPTKQLTDGPTSQWRAHELDAKECFWCVVH